MSGSIESPANKILVDEIRDLIVATLSLEDIKGSDIDPSAPLFGEGLGLDSIDALELGVAIQKKYGVLMDPASPEVRTHFTSILSLAAFIEQGKKAN